jgi:hypothetical protein
MDDEDQEQWWNTFFDDPCDDVSGENLHLWIGKTKSSDDK